LPHSASRDEIVAFLLDELTRRLGVGRAGIDLDADLGELGVKSIDAVLVSGELEDRFGIEIEPVLLFECRTVNRVADSVMETIVTQ
jgi:acyl carrier protein